MPRQPSRSSGPQALRIVGISVAIVCFLILTIGVVFKPGGEVSVVGIFFVGSTVLIGFGALFGTGVVGKVIDLLPSLGSTRRRR